MAQLVTSLVLSRIHQCYSVLINLPVSTISPRDVLRTPLPILSSILIAEPVSLQFFSSYTGNLFNTELSSQSLPLIHFSTPVSS